MTARSPDSVSIAHLDELVAASEYHLQQLERQAHFLKTAGLLPPSKQAEFNYHTTMIEGSAIRLRDALTAIGATK